MSSTFQFVASTGTPSIALVAVAGDHVLSWRSSPIMRTMIFRNLGDIMRERTEVILAQVSQPDNRIKKIKPLRQLQIFKFQHSAIFTVHRLPARPIPSSPKGVRSRHLPVSV